MSLYDILACPICKVKIEPFADHVRCPQCQCRYPIVQGVPIMLPGGTYNEVQFKYGLNPAEVYAPWVHRMILQSLTDDQIALDVGSGDMLLDDPCIIRMDIKLTPYVDLVADFHALPFLPGSVDYVFSLAVFEHLRQPFVAGQEIKRVLKPGGYVYAEANFVYPYHGYPHHYFNISVQGFEQIFAEFTHLKRGVAPYQMPGFALDFVLAAYLDVFRPETGDEHALAEDLRRALEHPLHDYDQKILPDEAYRVAAGTFLIGQNQPVGNESIIPAIVQETYTASPELQARFPHPTHIFEPDNLLYWAQTEGRQQYPGLAEYFDKLPKFSKYINSTRLYDRTAIRSLPPIPPPGMPWFKDERRRALGAGRSRWNYLLYKTWYHFTRAEFRLIWVKFRAFLTLQGRHAK